MNEIAAKHSDDEKAADAIALLAALTQPEDAEISPDEVKEFRSLTANIVKRDAH